jgi:hypothetical protein
MTTDPASLLQQLLAAGAVTQPRFDPSSRYYGLPVLAVAGAHNDAVQYVSRRFVPDPATLTVLQRHRVQQGDRIDVIAASLLGNPLSYWQICDANRAVDPGDVTAEPGVFIDVTLPSGAPGA